MDVVDVFQHRDAFFQVLQQTRITQTAVMTIEPGRDAGPPERHDGDQIIYVIEGDASITIGETTKRCGPGALAVVRAGAEHHVKNAGALPLFFVTIYSPPQY
ncbi:MAG: cupin domain-containing protein [Candidatus Rokuibacteriota bacterium]